MYCRFAVRQFFCVFFLVASFSSTIAQIGEWKVYTSRREVRGVALQQGVVWAATTGGLFAYSYADNVFQEFSTVSGLRTIDLTAITIDSYGTVWLGTSSGLIHAYKPSWRQWKYVTDIASFGAAQKRINVLKAFGDTLYIGSQIGLSSYLISSGRIGIFTEDFGVGLQIKGNVLGLIVYQDSIWVGTQQGIAAAPISHPNLRDPASWSIWQSDLPSRVVSSLAIFDNVLYAATAQGLVRYNGSSWDGVPGTEGKNILQILAHNDLLFFCTSTELFTIDTLGNISLMASFPSLTSFAVESSNIVVGSFGNGVYIRDGSSWISKVPNGPPSNSFVGLAVDKNGNLWSGTGTTSNLGFAKYDGLRWRTYSPLTDTILGPYGGCAYQIDIGNDNTKWVSLFGAGVVMVGNNDEIKQVFNTTNGLPFTKNAANNTSFVVVTGVVTDYQGDAWINVRNANGGNLLAVYTPATNSFRYVRYPSPIVPVLLDVVNDKYGTKWFTSMSEPGVSTSPGLVFYDETRRLPNRIDTTGWGVITTADGLTNNEVSALAVDNDGNLWVGAPDNGISIIIDPVRAPTRILMYHPLGDQRVNDILVDPLNKKWVATDHGVFVLSPDGTSILERYTVESTNGILPDDKVYSLAINRSTGVVYIGTEKGLAALTTPAIIPKQAFSELTIFPNPYYLPASKMLTVDGLVQGSTINILTANGDLVKVVRTAGGRIGFWDGKNENDELVASGIYLIVAYAEDGRQTATGKVAVLRK